MPPRFFLRAGLLARCAEFDFRFRGALRRAGFALAVRGRWRLVGDLRLCFAAFWRRLPPNPALICAAVKCLRFFVLATFRRPLFSAGF